MINYRANIWALSQFEPKAVIALASVGAVLPEDDIGAIAVPDQIIDYTWGRETSYNTGKEKFINFIDFTYPFDMDLRAGGPGGGGGLHRGQPRAGAQPAVPGREN